MWVECTDYGILHVCINCARYADENGMIVPHYEEKRHVPLLKFGSRKRSGGKL